MRMIDRTPKGASTTLGGPAICLDSIQEEAKRNAPAARLFCAVIDKTHGTALDLFKASVRRGSRHLQGGLR